MSVCLDSMASNYRYNDKQKQFRSGEKTNNVLQKYLLDPLFHFHISYIYTCRQGSPQVTVNCEFDHVISVSIEVKFQSISNATDIGLWNKMFHRRKSLNWFI